MLLSLERFFEYPRVLERIISQLHRRLDYIVAITISHGKNRSSVDPFITCFFFLRLNQGQRNVIIMECKREERSWGWSATRRRTLQRGCLLDSSPDRSPFAFTFSRGGDERRTLSTTPFRPSIDHTELLAEDPLPRPRFIHTVRSLLRIAWKFIFIKIFCRL